MQPAAAVIPKQDPNWPIGKCGQLWPRTPACDGYTLIAEVRPGTPEAIRGHGYKLAAALDAEATAAGFAVLGTIHSPLGAKPGFGSGGICQ
jgi:hypothetical protein